MEPVWQALQEGRSKEVLGFFQNKEIKSQINRRNADGLTALHLAVQLEDTNVVKTLLDSGANPNQLDKCKGWSSCHWAAHTRHLNNLFLLMGRGGNVSVKDKNGLTAMDLITALKKRELSENGNNDKLELYTWGAGMNFQLGTGIAQNRNSPTLVQNLEGKKPLAISCSKFHTCVLTTTGELFTCGFGKGGRLGHGDEEPQFLPKRVDRMLIGKRVEEVCASSVHTIIRTDEGDAYTCGTGELGQLGLGSDEVTTNVFKRVKALDSRRVIRIACSRNISLCGTSAKEIFSFGNSALGALGYDAQEAPQFFPRMISSFKDIPFDSLAAGSHHSVIVYEGEPYIVGCGKWYPRRVFLGTKVSHVAAGGNRTVAVTGEGSVFTWEGDGKDSLKKLSLTKVASSTVAPGGGHAVFLCHSGEAWEWHPGDPTDSLELWDLRRVRQVALSRVHTAALVATPKQSKESFHGALRFKEYVANSEWSDCQFVGAMGTVPAHKILVAARSPHLRRRWFPSSPSQEIISSVISVPDNVTRENVVRFVEFLYTDVLDTEGLTGLDFDQLRRLGNFVRHCKRI